MVPLSPPVWLRQVSYADARLGFDPTTSTGPWQGGMAGQPALASFSPTPGQIVTVGANVGVGASVGLAGSPLRGLGLQPVGIVTRWQARGWSAGFSSGAARNGALAMDTASLATPLGFGVELASLRERGQLLGLRGSPGGGSLAGDSTLVTLTGQRLLAGIALSGRATLGRTRAQGGSALLDFSTPITSSAFSVEGSRGLLGGLATLGVASPLRVERARASVLVPVSYDLVTGVLNQERRILDLTPGAREFDLSVGWAADLSRSASLRLGVAHALAAGHVAGASDTAGFFTLSIR